jgi:APA family basic amino acid/polyamine antiporter
MSLDGELPKAFSWKLRSGAPIISELVIGTLVIVLVLTGGVLLSLGISSFAVLLYYAITNFAAFRQPLSESNRPRQLSLVGLALCLLLALSVPLEGLLVGTSLLVIAMLLRWGLRAAR